MRRAGVALVLALVLSSLLMPAVAAQDTVEDAYVQNSSALGETDAGETIISGLDDPDLSLVGVEYSDGVATLEIRSSESKRIKVADAFASGGQAATIIRPQSRSLSEGVNEVQIEANSMGGTAIVNLMGSGQTAQIPIDAGGGFGGPPETTDSVAWGAGLGAAGVFAVALAWIKREFAGQEQEREL